MLPGCYLSTNTLCSLRIILDLKRLCHNIFDHSSQKLLLRSRRSNSERGNSEEEGYLKEWASSSDLSIKLAFSVLIGVFQVARRRGGSLMLSAAMVWEVAKAASQWRVGTRYPRLVRSGFKLSEVCAGPPIALSQLWDFRANGSEGGAGMKCVLQAAALYRSISISETDRHIPLVPKVED